MNHSFKKIIYFFIVISVLLSVSGCGIRESLNEPVDASDESYAVITIPSGASTTKIAEILKEKDLIKNVTAFKMLSKDLSADGKMMAGDYYLSRSMNSKAMIEKFVSGDVYIETLKFTIPEGYEIRQIADKLSEEDIIDREKFYDVLKNHKFDYDFIDEKVIENNYEGFLFPDTYEIPIDSDEIYIINLMLKRFDSIYGDEFKSKAEEMGMSTYDVVTFASIVEREAKLDSERSLVSGVFHNRLKIGMAFQSCATVQYILQERKEILTYDDIEIESPYNTYIYKGLPPSPIACPGEKSIRATLYPEQSDYLYFVASKENDGSHIFSKTYKEHMNAQKKQ